MQTNKRKKTTFAFLNKLLNYLRIFLNIKHLRKTYMKEIYSISAHSDFSSISSSWKRQKALVLNLFFVLLFTLPAFISLGQSQPFP